MQSDQETNCFKKFKLSIQDPAHTAQDFGAIGEEVELIYEVKDICDELHLIIRVLENQLHVLTEFADLFWPSRGHTSETAQKHREEFLRHTGVRSLLDRAKRLKENAQRTLDSVCLLRWSTGCTPPLQLKALSSNFGGDLPRY